MPTRRFFFKCYNIPMLKIITVPDPLLRKKSENIKKIDKEILSLIKQLTETATKKEGTKGVGLSAVQVGIPKRIFIAYSDKSRKFLAFINPKIVWYSKRKMLGIPHKNKLEGCLSVPNIWGLVKRHQVIKMRYQTPSGQIITRKFKGFMGIVCQHEYDHLEGILFTDRILEQKGKVFELKQDKEGREELEEIKLV